MKVPDVLLPGQLEAITDPAALLERAWALDPALRMAERYATLDRLELLLADGPLPPAPPGRSWELELLAERAVDHSMNVRLDEALTAAETVLRDADQQHGVARARATLARGRALAWVGTDDATRQADGVLAEAAELFRVLGEDEWRGFAVFWRGWSVHYENGNLRRAVELIGEGLEILPADSHRRSTALDFYADALLELGELDRAQAALDEAAAIAQAHDESTALAYVNWSRAHLLAARGDAFATERTLREVERYAGDWFDSHIGLAFLNDAVQVLDRVGLTDEAEEYLARAIERAPEDESTRQSKATLLARSGDPGEALAALQELARGDWLDKRLIWRHTLMTAWATFRAGRSGSGELAARALDQAVACGDIRVAVVGEPQIVSAMAPLAEDAGSAAARELLLGGRELIVRLFGAPELVMRDGRRLDLPPGKPGELIRLLAINPHGLPVDMVLEAFFPDAPPAAGRQRLRQILTRLRSVVGDIVIRSDDTLTLVPSWVDIRAFTDAADRARGASGPRSVQFAYAALAVWRGPPLHADRYATWAEELRYQLEYRHLALLDLIAADADARGSHQEALTALDAAVAQDPEDLDRYAKLADQLLALGRHATAEYLAGRAGVSVRAGVRLHDQREP